MGRNLASNLLDKGFKVSGWDADNQWVKDNSDFCEQSGLKHVENLNALLDSVKSPKKILLLIPAGNSVDQIIAELSVILSPGDVLVDCGNSNYKDSMARGSRLLERDVNFVGLGLSGGALGALHGPSLMFGGNDFAWGQLLPILERVAAKGRYGPCIKKFGSFGAGHFVKMVHNGIEYAEMQIIAEAHDLMSRGLGLSHRDQSDFFKDANEGRLGGFLTELAANVLSSETTSLDQIIDSAEQKGTGAWAVNTALDLGVSTPSIDAAVGARLLSSFWQERQRRSEIFRPSILGSSSKPLQLADLEKAIWFAKVCTYAQGFDLLKAGNETHGWDISIEGVCSVWTEGCIIRGKILNTVVEGLSRDPGCQVLEIPSLKEALMEEQRSIRSIVRTGVSLGIPTSGLFAALSWFDSFSSSRLPHAITQAQRDAFGAHGIRLFGNPKKMTHGDW